MAKRQLVAHRHKHAGFTYAELIAVVAIIAIVSTAIFSYFGSQPNTRQMRFALEEFQSRLQLAKQQALLKSMVLGVQIKKSEYIFYQFLPATSADESNKWELFTDRNLSRHQLPGGVSATLTSSAQTDLLLPETDNTTEADEALPQIIIYPSRELSPFILTFSNQALRLTIKAQANGEIELLEANQ